MPAKCFWDDDEKTLYCVHMDDKWTWDDFLKAIKESYAMLGELDYQVDFLMGFLSRLPSGGAIIPLTYAGENQPPNIRHTVILNQSGRATTMFISSLVGAVDAVHDWDGPKFVESMEEAREYLQSLRE